MSDRNNKEQSRQPGQPRNHQKGISENNYYSSDKYSNPPEDTPENPNVYNAGDAYERINRSFGLNTKNTVITYDRNINDNNFGHNVWARMESANYDDYNAAYIFMKSNPDFQRSVTYLDVFSPEECDEIIDWFNDTKHDPDSGKIMNKWDHKSFDLDAPQDIIVGNDYTHLGQNNVTDNKIRNAYREMDNKRFDNKHLGVEEHLNLHEEFGKDGDGMTWRKSDTIFMDNYIHGMEWVSERLSSVLDKVNRDYFKFDIPRPIPFEAMQVTYYPPGGVYEWHQDWNGNIQPQNTRKISLGVQLSHPDEYVGGNLQFQIPRNDAGNNASRQQGSVTLFPSFLMHRLSTVVEGERYSLIAWAHGNFWR